MLSFTEKHHGSGGNMGVYMTGMLLILASLLVHQAEALIVKFYGLKYGKGGMFFNAVICLAAVIYFVITDKGGFEFPKGIWLYGIVNSLMYGVGFYSGYVAYKIGSFGLTRLFTSFGVVISTFFGIIFFKESATFFTYLAILLIVTSLFLMNYRKRQKNATQEISVRWVIFVLLTVASNAAITVIGKMQHSVFGDVYSNEYLIISYLGAAMFLFIFGVFFERDSIKPALKHGILFGAAAGIFNGINNLLGLLTYSYLPLSFISPVKTGGGIIISFIVSVLLFRERFSRRQYASVIIGIIAVILMNIKL